MGLFKSAEEKAEIQAQKEQKVLEQYGLQNLSDPEDIASVKKIAAELAGSGLSEFGALLSGNDTAMNRAQTQYVRAVMEQNFIIIRQLDRIANLLNK